MTKVLFILDDLSGGGAERVFVNIANGFAANNILVEFLVGEKKGVYLEILNSSIPINEVGGTSLLKYLTTFPGVFRQNNYTHIFTASHYASSAAIISKKITRISTKVYLTHHYSLPASRPLQYFKGDIVLKLIHFFITPHADKIIAVSSGSLEWLRKYSHHKLKQGIFIYNPVYNESIYPLAKEHVEFPIDIKDKIVLLNVGRLAEQKDHLTLIKAFAIFKQSHASAVLFILGTGPLQSMLENYIQKNNLSSCIFLIGFEPNPYKWMAKSDLLILSSIYEGFGNVIVEAMALGKTVVSTNCPSGPNEILQQGALGYLCPVKDPAEMSKSIEKALQMPFDSNILIQSTHQYTIKETVNKYIEVL
jgi:glycosyltransferase involved in cell wall biosynthesis